MTVAGYFPGKPRVEEPRISFGPTVEVGFEAEGMLEELLKGPFSVAFHFTEDIDNVSSEIFSSSIVFRKATPEEDKEEKFDFMFYFGSKDNNLKVDLTVSRDPDTLNYKKSNERKYPDYAVLILRLQTLKNACRGASRDKEEILQDLIQTFYCAGKLIYDEEKKEYRF